MNGSTLTNTATSGIGPKTFFGDDLGDLVEKTESRDAAAESDGIMAVIVDTNVAVVANGQSPQASSNSIDTCIYRIEAIIRGEEKLVLDNGWIILGEYLRNLRSSGEPGAGDRLLRWILANKDRLCDLVPITPVDGAENEFEEFPDDSALNGFRSQMIGNLSRLHVAHPERPPILQGGG